MTLKETMGGQTAATRSRTCFNGHTVTSSDSNTNNSLLRVFAIAKVNLTDCAATPGGLRATAI